MKHTWADILPKPIPPDEYKLVGEDPRDADEEVATADWPLPVVKPWAPAPARESLFWQVVEALS